MAAEVYLGLDQPCVVPGADPLVQWWEQEHLRLAVNYWEQRPWDPKYRRWAKLGRDELQKRKVTALLLR